MIWWQIVVICLVAIAIGAATGLLIDYLISRFRRKRATNSARGGNGLEAILKVKVERHKPTATIVPLLSRRSIVFLSIGLVLGICLGLGYWAISPVQVGFSGEWPLIKVAGLTAPRPTVYESRVLVNIVGWWTRGAERERLETFGEYSEATLNTSLFMTYLSEELAKANVKYQRSPEELDEMVTASYRYAEHYVRVLVTSYDPEESNAVADLIARIFPSYLDEQAGVARSEQYQRLLQKLDKNSVDLVEVDTELAVFTAGQDTDAGDPTLNPDYIVLQTKATALSGRLSELSLAQMALDLDSDEYLYITREMADISLEYVLIRKDIDALNSGSNAEEFKTTPAYITLTAKQSALEYERSNLIRSLTSLNSEYLEQLDLIATLALDSPSAPVPLAPDRIKGRYALIMGTLLGLFGAWLVLNFRALVQQVRSSPLISGAEQEKEEKEGEQPLGESDAVTPNSRRF